MLIELNVQGYRSLKNVQWKPGALNVVIGPNGSGKSNLLRVFELFSASADGKLSQFIQREGGILALTWDGDWQTIFFEIDLEYIKASERDMYSYSFGLEPVTPTMAVVIPETLSVYDKDGGKMVISREGNFLTIYGEKVQEIRSRPSQETVLSQKSDPFDSDTEIYDLKQRLVSNAIFQDLTFARSSPVRLAQVTRFENQISTDGQNLITVMHTLYTSDRDFKNRVNEGMRAAFGADFEELTFPPAADQRIQMRVRWKSLKREQSAADLSDGTLRFLFLITVLASPDPPPLIAIDEPETGLHPSMMPIIAEYAVEAAERTQIIFTTHSAAFLDAFPKESRPTVTVARWEDGETKLQIVNDDELKRFLERYTLGELYRSGELESELFAE